MSCRCCMSGYGVFQNKSTSSLNEDWPCRHFPPPKRQHALKLPPRYLVKVECGKDLKQGLMATNFCPYPLFWAYCRFLVNWSVNLAGPILVLWRACFQAHHTHSCSAYYQSIVLSSVAQLKVGRCQSWFYCWCKSAILYPLFAGCCRVRVGRGDSGESAF